MACLAKILSRKGYVTGGSTVLIKRIDDDSYARKFTPRTNHENWSNSNKRRIAKLLREGRMTAIGLQPKSVMPVPKREPASSKPKAIPTDQRRKPYLYLWNELCYQPCCLGELQPDAALP